MAQLIRKWAMSCEQCMKELWINETFTRPPMQNYNGHVTGTEDDLQILFGSGTSSITWIRKHNDSYGFVPRYLFADPTASHDAKKNCQSHIQLDDKALKFPNDDHFWEKILLCIPSNQELANLQVIIPEHPMTKHAQTIGILQRTLVHSKKHWR